MKCATGVSSRQFILRDVNLTFWKKKRSRRRRGGGGRGQGGERRRRLLILSGQ